MLTQLDASRLKAQMHRELQETSTTLWKCAAGLLFITAITVVGSGFSANPDAPAYASSQGASRR